MDLDDQSINLNPEKLGIDSLVAVDLQSWFRKEIGIVIPTLKILNAPTISSLLQSAEELITPDMTPLLQSPSRAPQEMDTTLQFKALDESVSQLPSEPLVSSASATSYDRNDPASSFYVGSQASSNSPVTSEPDISSIIENSDTFSDSNLVIESSVPMSFPQSLFWFLRSFVEDETAFNVTSKAFFKGRLDGSKLGRALKEVGQAHEVLRTRFQADSFTGTPLQKISESTLLHLEHVTGATEADVEEAIRELRNHSFQLEQGDLLRMKLLSISAEAHYLVLSYHHIVMDGIGFQIFFTELEKAYYGQLAFSNSKSPQYSAFTRRQIHDFEQGVWSEEFDYWRRQLTPLPPPLNLLSLVVHKSRPEVSVFRSYTAELRLEKMLDESIQRCCQQMNVTPFHFHLAVFGALLCRYSSDDSTSDLCIGVADGNRKDADSLRTLGLFLNMLPLRLRFESEQPFSELLVQTKAGSDDAFSHSRTPFNLLLEKLQVPRVLSQSPLFQCFFNYRKGIHEAPERFGCQVQGELVSGGQTAYDISIDIADSVGRGSPVILAVNAALYSQHDADILLRSYIRLLQEFSKNPAARIKWPPVHDECEIEEAVNRGKGKSASDFSKASVLLSPC
jgi:hybrid polyketide synthase / nonribosomal peptide synthetase ACE1